VWGFGGGYLEAGVSNIGTPNATLELNGGGVIGGGGVVGAGPVEVEGGVLWENGKTLYSLPLGSGTPDQNANQWSGWNPNQYGGIEIGNSEIGHLYGCNGTSCTLTLFYGRATPPLGGNIGPINGKAQLWGGIGASVTWPSPWRWPW